MSSALDDALDNVEFTEDTPATDEPKRTRRQRSDKGMPRGRAASHKQLVEDLLVPYVMIAEGSALLVPTGSAVLLQRAEKTVTSLVKIGAKNPKTLAAMKKASVIGPTAEIASTVFAFLIASAVDLGRIPPEHPLSLNTGVGQLYMEMHPDRVPGNNTNSMPWPPPQGDAFTPFNPAQGM